MIDKHNTAVHDLQRLPCFLHLLAQIILQVGQTGGTTRRGWVELGDPIWGKICCWTSNTILHKGPAASFVCLRAVPLYSMCWFMTLSALTVLTCVSWLQAQLDLLVSAVSGLEQHLQGPGNALQVQLLLQGPGGAHMSPGQDETLKVGAWNLLWSPSAGV